MMYASVRGVDGSVVSLGAIDLTAPDGMGRLAALAQAASVPGAGAPNVVQQARSGPPGSMRVAQGAQIAPATCHFRVPVRTGAGLQWGWRTMPCPPGITPGHYVRVQPGR